MTSVPIRHSGEGRNPESPIIKNTAASHRIGIPYSDVGSSDSDALTVTLWLC